MLRRTPSTLHRNVSEKNEFPSFICCTYLWFVWTQEKNRWLNKSIGNFQNRRAAIKTNLLSWVWNFINKMTKNSSNNFPSGQSFYYDGNSVFAENIFHFYEIHEIIFNAQINNQHYKNRIMIPSPFNVVILHKYTH